MGFVSIFGKSTTQNAYLPKISILLQFGGEILALLCPGDSTQTLLILSQFLTFGMQYLKGHCQDDLPVFWSKLLKCLTKNLFCKMKLLLQHREENIKAFLEGKTNHKSIFSDFSKIHL